MDFINTCLKLKPRERPTPAESLKHPWFHSENLTQLTRLDSQVMNNMKTFETKGQLKNEMLCCLVDHISQNNV